MEPQNITLRYVVEDEALTAAARKLDQLTEAEARMAEAATRLSQRWQQQQTELRHLQAEEQRLHQQRAQTNDPAQQQALTAALGQLRQQMAALTQGEGQRLRQLMQEIGAVNAKVQLVAGVEQFRQWARTAHESHAQVLNDAATTAQAREALETRAGEQRIRNEKQVAREVARAHREGLSEIEANLNRTRQQLGTLQQVWGQVGESVRSIAELVIAGEMRQIDARQAAQNHQRELTEERIRQLEAAEQRATGAQQRELQVQLTQQRAYLTTLLNENQQLEARKRGLAREGAVVNKVLATLQAGISTALAVTNMLAAPVPPPGNFILAGVVAAMGAAQVATIAATPLARGVIDLQGPGTETSDSIPARLSRGESVLTAEETRLYRPLLWAIRRRELEPTLARQLALQSHSLNLALPQTHPHTTHSTDDRLVRQLVAAVERLPVQQVSLSAEGLQHWVQRGQQRSHYLHSRT